MIPDKEINAFLNEHHISHMHLGYTYLMAGIRMQLEEKVPRGHIQELYRAIAEMYHTKEKLVDAAIHRSIVKANLKTTNKEFIVLATDELTFGAEPDS